jgi:hypothetical protein
MTVQQHVDKLESKGKLAPSQHLEAMKVAAAKFNQILTEDQQGLASWWEMLGESGRELAAHLRYSGIDDGPKGA